MTFFIYNQLMRLLLPLLLLRLKRKSAKMPEYGMRWDERLAKKVINVAPGGVLFHVASLGEAIAATPIIQQFMINNVGVAVTVTSITPTGSAHILKTFGSHITHCYMPFDLPFIQSRFIQHIKPSLLVLMETELWPNLIYRAKKSGAQIMVVNGRLSDKSLKGYLKFPALSKLMMNSIDAIAAQYSSDAKNFEQLGANAKKIHVVGNIKCDVRMTGATIKLAEKYREQWRLARPVWLAASTHAGEEEQLLDAHQQLLQRLPNALLIIVPRHPERFNGVFEQVQLRFNGQRKTDLSLAGGQVPAQDVEVIVGDTLGEMMLYIALSNAVFMGGSLVARGGHNPFEAACQRKAILTGPHVFNFANGYSHLAAYNAINYVTNAVELQQKLLQLLTDETENLNYANNAYQSLQAVAGTQQQTLALIYQQFKIGSNHKNTLLQRETSALYV